ncbi:MAG: C-GCAxxG-C-C family (seleno)protein [Desulfurivibrionaceae bacterium]
MTNSKNEGISRRELLIGAGYAAAGIAAASAVGSVSLPGTASAGKKATSVEGVEPWPYKKLDPDKIAEKAYHEWYGNFCSMAVAEAILGELREKVGGPYKDFPVHSIRWGHGGAVGWGTLCGTLMGAGTVAALVTGIETGESVANDLMYWYSVNSLPKYKPQDPKMDAPVTSRADSPLCHVSVNKWMTKAGYEFFTPERKDRCARVAADIARQTVVLLNQVQDLDYEPTHGNQMKTHDMTAQNNCLDCHSS